MKIQNKDIQKLLEYYKDIVVLSQINAVLSYDLNVSMPPKGSDARALQTAYVTGLQTEKWNDPSFKELVETIDASKLNLEEKAILRNIKHAGHYYWSIPKETIVAFSEVTSKAFVVWAEAKKKNDFKMFLPHLKEVISLTKAN